MRGEWGKGWEGKHVPWGGLPPVSLPGRTTPSKSLLSWQKAHDAECCVVITRIYSIYYIILVWAVSIA